MTEGMTKPMQTLSSFIRRQQSDILDDWERAVRALPIARELDRPALLDHVPILLDRIADMAEALAEGKTPPSPTIEGATEHALHRLGEGFDVSEVIAEYATLRECLMRLWEREPIAPRRLAELRLLNHAIDKAVAESVSRYVHARDRALQALDRVSTAAFESKDVDDFLGRLLRVLVETTPAIDTAAILMREGECLRVRAVVGVGHESVLDMSLAVGEGSAARVAVERRPVVLCAKSDTPNSLLEKLGIKVLCSVPLVDDGHVIGMALMGSRSAHEFSEQDERLLAAIVTRATAAILQHTLREVAETRARRQETIARLGSMALQIGDAERLMNHAVELVAKALVADLVGIYEVLPDANELLLRAGIGWNEGAVGRATVHAGPNSAAGYTLVTGDAVIMEDISAESRFRVPALLEGHGVISGVSVVIHAPGPGSIPYGVLAAFTRTRRSFSFDEMSFLQSVANLIAQAIVRNNMEQSLRRSEERFRSLVTASSAAVWTANARGFVEEPSPSWRAFTGQSTEQFRGWGWLDAIHPDDRARERDTWDRAVKQTAIYETEYRLRFHTGEYRWTLVRGVPVVDANGSTREWVGMNIDMTQRKRIEEQLESIAKEREELIERLRESNEKWQMLVTGAPLAILALDESARIEIWNPAAERLFGWPADEVLGRRTPLIPADKEAEFQNNMAMLVGAGQPVTMEVTRLRRDGSRIELSLWAAPRRDAHGKIIGTLAVCADMTEAKRAREQIEQALRQAQEAVRVRETVLAVVSHDLRNPLNVINLNGTLLSKLLQHDTRARQRVEIIQRSAARMARLIGDLLDMASIQVGRLAIERSAHEVHTLVAEAVDFHQSIAIERTIDLKSMIRVPRAMRVTCDRERIMQVLSNLLGNAIKFSAAGGVIIVAAEQRDGEVSFSVTDHGSGIAPELMSHIFEPFWTMPQGSQKGTGLGLFIAKGIIDAHGTRIWAESKVGVGTTFSFTLPIDCSS